MHGRYPRTANTQMTRQNLSCIYFFNPHQRNFPISNPTALTASSTFLLHLQRTNRLLWLERHFLFAREAALHSCHRCTAFPNARNHDLRLRIVVREPMRDQQPVRPERSCHRHRSFILHQQTPEPSTHS